MHSTITFFLYHFLATIAFHKLQVLKFSILNFMDILSQLENNVNVNSYNNTFHCQVYWTYSSISSSRTSVFDSGIQILNSMSSVVAVGRFFANHGGLLN